MSGVLYLFSLIATSVHEFTLYNSVKLVNFVERMANSEITENRRKNIILMLEFLAKIIQNHENKNYNLLLVVYQKTPIFKKLKAQETQYGAPLDIILKYCSTAKAELAKSSRKQITADEARNLLQAIPIAEVFPGVREFEAHPHVFGGNMKNQWVAWSEIFFARSSTKDLEALRMKPQKDQ